MLVWRFDLCNSWHQTGDYFVVSFGTSHLFGIHLQLLLPAQHNRRHNFFPSSRVLTVSRVDRNTVGLFLWHRAISSWEKTIINWLLPFHEHILVARHRPFRLRINDDHSLRERPPEQSVLKEPNFYHIWDPNLRNIQLFYHRLTIKTGTK